MSICRTHTSINLYDLQRKYRKRQYHVPSWQRGDAWSDAKKQNFENAIREKARRGKDVLSGCIILYTIKGEEMVYIADGLQRAINVTRIFDKLVKEIGETHAEDFLSRISVVVLEMEYENENEAKNEFRRMNMGTPLTEMEEARTILTDLPNFYDWEMRIFKPLHETMDKIANQFNVKEPQTRNKRHARERDNYALFLRYLTGNKDTNRYSMSCKNIDAQDSRNLILEARLVNHIKSSNIEEIEQKLTSFQKFLTDQAMYFKTLWQEMPKDTWNKEIQTLTGGCFRFLLHFAIYRKNNNFPVDFCEKFIIKLLDACKGSTLVRFEDGTYNVIGNSDLSSVTRFQSKLDCSFDPDIDNKLARKKVKTNQLLPGMSNAHVKPYSKNTNGDEQITTPIPTTKNQSMGVLSMTND